MLLGCERLSSRLPIRARRLVRPGGDQSRRAKSWVASLPQASRSRFLGEARMQNATTKKLKHIFGQCKVLAIGGGRGGTSDVCSGDGRRGRYHTDGRMKRRHILVKVCVHLANRMQASFVGSALSSKRLSWNFEGFIFGGGPPKCYLEQATKVQSYKTEHVLCFSWPLSGSKPFFKLRIEPSTF